MVDSACHCIISKHRKIDQRNILFFLKKKKGRRILDEHRYFSSVHKEYIFHIWCTPVFFNSFVWLLVFFFSSRQHLRTDTYVWLFFFSCGNSRKSLISMVQLSVCKCKGSIPNEARLEIKDVKKDQRFSL